MDFSVVVPVYGCREALPELYARLVAVFEGMGKTFEIVLVDDHDPYDSWSSVRELCVKDDRVHGIKLARNFGQIRAITAGLDCSRGDWVVVMDCDLQDRPEAIPDLYAKALEGYDVVFAKRVERKDSALTKLLSRAFYKVYDYFTDGNYDPTLCNFSIARRIVVNQYCQMREHNRGYAMFIKWLGFKQAAIEVVGDARFSGKSSYDFGKKISMACELITAQSNKPLRFSVNLGFALSACSLLFLIWNVVRKLFIADVAVGWTSLISSVFFMGGLVLASIGVVGLYIGNIFTEVKNRPLYVVETELNKGA